MIDVQERPDSNIVELHASGSLSTVEFDDTLAKLKAAMDRHGRIRLLQDIGELDAPPIPWSRMWEDIKFSFEHLSDISHVAVVADQTWISAYVNMMKPVMKPEMKHFKRADLDAARAWIEQAS
jgi:hypothetical protein